MTSKTPPAAPDVDVATAVVEAAERRAGQAAEDVDRARLEALDAARLKAAAVQAEADQAAAELRQREADWQDTLARQAAEQAAERLEAERSRLVGLRAEIVAERQALEDELPGLLRRVLEIGHALARWETRRVDLRGQPSQLAQTATQILGNASAVAMPPYGIESDSFPAMAAAREVPPAIQRAIGQLFVTAQQTDPPTAG
jgi:hypothetical protein